MILFSLQCSYHKCSRSTESNYEAIVAFAEAYGEIGQSYPCYYDPDDMSYVIMDILTTSTVIHCMLWPAVALLLGMLIVSLYVCDVECLAKKKRHRPQEQNPARFNSTERPWTRHDNTTPYQKVLTISWAIIVRQRAGCGDYYLVLLIVKGGFKVISFSWYFSCAVQWCGTWWTTVDVKVYWDPWRGAISMPSELVVARVQV